MDLHCCAFRVLDKNSTGFLTVEELQAAAFIVLGVELSIGFITEFVVSDKSDLQTFILLCKEAAAKFHIPECNVNARSKFSSLDEFSNGFLTFNDFSRIVGRFCYIPNFRLKKIFSVFDSDGDGYVTFKDLATLLN